MTDVLMLLLFALGIAGAFVVIVVDWLDKDGE